MKTVEKILWIAMAALFCCGVFFCVPVLASEQSGEYLCTLGPGESISTRGVAYGIYQISATNINACSGWCPGCSSGAKLTYYSGRKMVSDYLICVDGYTVLDYSDATAGTGTIDFSAYTSKDAVITMPENYTVKQKISCSGGTYSGGGTCDPCSYSTTKTIEVTGSMQLYGYSKIPEVTANPSPVQAGTDQSAAFTAAGDKVAACRWQKITSAGITDLRDGEGEGGVVYSGTGTLQLNISKLRLSLNNSSYRCILIGEKGDEVATEAASLTVTDISPPKVQLSISPSGRTEGPVTVRISATDPDTGLANTPYHYLGADHTEASFSVEQNGNYEVIVKDAAGNTARSSVSVSNIQPKPVPTPTATPTQKPTVTPTVGPTPVPTVNPTPRPTTNPVINPTPKPTGTPTVKPAGDETKKTNEREQKNVNIRNLTAGKQEQEKEEITETETEEVEEEVVLSEPSEEEIEPEIVAESDPVGMIILLCLGLLLLLLLLFFALLFPVRVENADELGNWHFCALKLLRYRKGWELHLGLLLEDFDSLRLKFGMLFLALIGNNSLKVTTAEGESVTLKNVSQDQILHYHQIGGEQG